LLNERFIFFSHCWPRSGKIFLEKMALSRENFRQKVDKVKQSVDIKDVIESTGARAVSGNASKGEYLYHAPYRRDDKASLKINTLEQVFVDYSNKDELSGDVLELTRLIFGKGDKNAMPFFKAVEWLERFSGTSVAPRAIQPAQRRAAGRVRTSNGERFVFVKATPVSSKTHPANLDYISGTRKISLRVASRYLHVVTYRDTDAEFEDKMNGFRYGIGSKNDNGGWEIRAASQNSDFKMSLLAKGITTYPGHPMATIGHLFNGQFDYLTRLEIVGENQPFHPSIVTNSDSLVVEAAKAIKRNPDLKEIKVWHVHQDNDDSGMRSTQAFCDELGEGYEVYTLNPLWDGFKDLNKCWTDAPADRISKLKSELTGIVQARPKFYDTSATAEHRRFQDKQRDDRFNKPEF